MVMGDHAGVPEIKYRHHFETRLWTAKERGMAVSAVRSLSHIFTRNLSEPWNSPPHTGGTPVPLSAPFIKTPDVVETTSTILRR